MKLHTLGPAATDSNAAAEYYQNIEITQSIQIELHQSYEEILHNLRQYRGDYLLIPAAFQSITGLSWGQTHYRYLDQLQLRKTFIHQLNPLVLVKKQGNNAQIGYTHAATADLLRQLCPELQEIRLCDSKFQAYQRYLKDGDVVLTNQKNLTKNDHLVQKLEVPMIWCLYYIKGENDHETAQ
ncbi:hypothetical protein BGL34_06140 [Fructilactobacillus lindneri]|uniref:Amino acid biosynthesis protein n=2 Tax=Fructilactobacillus lindneri TaxID=53444 RepID=A0A0R2K2Z6_9LACO|nr:hypothetical protein [Fructilactobacillus lindneri]ANZ57492.1 hypothetical protein AYR60_01175 [Fructilactobacillus lindneri]ANZ58760.1 hypothetical protein AYR59_01175 [Fructilactobacillus lindneri]KRN80477.1 hypothetical protein IV52_GL000051 [Fructilactobacillus lindneri DSM 20690 = JCM 11027]POG97810.1 hypothetical protein BGL31_05605 [Fructilactobacillus lindneri]POG99143.1 hypothetical protein BGL32_05630 [Fructilactobacillus lindneri]